MKKIILSTFLIFFTITCKMYAKENDQQQMFDSIMNIMKDKTVPLIERYYMTGNIEHLKGPHKISILKELLPEAQIYEDKAVITRLYSLISVFYSNLSQFKESKTYIDSAFLYVDKIDNNVIKGLAYYSVAVYNANQSKMAEAHENYYKAADYFNKNSIKPAILNEIYYNLSLVYALENDVKSLKELVEWIKEIPKNFPVQRILQHTVEMRYYYGLYNQTNDISYLDSASRYNHLAFDIFHQFEQPYDVAYQVAENYLSQGDIFNHKHQYDSARIYLDRAIELMNPDNLHSQLEARLLSGRLFLYDKNYLKAETQLKEGLAQLEELSAQDVFYYNLISDYYGILSQVQENNGHMKNALESGRKSVDYKLKFISENKNKYIQDLRVKHDLDNKQRTLEQLTKINQVYRQNQLLLVGVAFLLVIIFILAILSAKKKRKIVQAKLNETQLASQLEKEKNLTLTAKIEENEQKYKLLLSENKLKQVNSYLAGLESERSRLSKELHDNIANGILSVSMNLKNTQNADIEQISDRLKAIQEQVRSISHELIPPFFQYATLTEVIYDYIENVNKTNKIQTFLSINSTDEINQIPEKACLEVYRIIQECVGNALKHADASQIEILLYMEKEKLHLSIIDDGKGFDTRAKHRGIGLLIIKERINSLNGKLTINTKPNTGTEINIII